MNPVFSVNDKVLYESRGPLRVCIIKTIVENKYRTGGYGYVLKDAATGDSVATAAARQLTLYTDKLPNKSKKMKANSTHYSDFKKVEFSQIDGSYTMRSRCGCLVRTFPGSIGLLSNEVSKLFTEDPLQVKCPICRRAISGMIEKINYQSMPDLERDKLMAKEISALINPYLVKNKEFTLMDFRNDMSDQKCKYYSQVIAMLKAKQFIIYSHVGVDKRGKDNMNLYKKATSDPIHYSNFLNIIKYRRLTYAQQLTEINTTKSDEQPSIKDALVEIERRRNSVPINKKQQFISTVASIYSHRSSLKDLEDKALVEELRSRGYTVQATKTIEL